MTILALVCMALAMATVSGLAFALYASLPTSLLAGAESGRYAGLTASERCSSGSSDTRVVRVGPLQDRSA